MFVFVFFSLGKDFEEQTLPDSTDNWDSKLKHLIFWSTKSLPNLMGKISLQRLYLNHLSNFFFYLRAKEKARHSDRHQYFEGYV